jgi:hypothetical protein
MTLEGLADARAWDELVEVFTATVTADWSALSGVPAAEVPAAELVDGWRAGLSGLTATQHLLGNQQIDLAGDTATATAYAAPVWVVAGSYTYELTRVTASSVSSMVH